MNGAVQGFIGQPEGGHYGCAELMSRDAGGNGMIGAEARGRMIVGIGTDLVEIERIERSIARFGERFLERVFTSGEQAYCLRKKNAAESFAARFAAKEAGAKALGTGISRGLGWLELEVTRAAGERPMLVLSGRAEERARMLGIGKVSLSLTHTRGLAMATVVMESDAAGEF